MATKITFVDDDGEDDEPEPADAEVSEPEDAEPGQEIEPAAKKKLTPGEIRARDAQIIAMDARGVPDRVIAKKFGMAVSSVHKAIHRTWALVVEEDVGTSRRKAAYQLRDILEEHWKLYKKEAWKTSPSGKQLYSPVTGKPLVDVVAKATILRQLLEVNAEYRKLYGSDAPRKKLTVTATAPDPEIMRELEELRRENGVEDTRTDPRVLKLIEGGILLDDDDEDEGDGDAASG